MNRVLVTGASGLVGRGALAPLVAADMEVHAASSRPAPPDGHGGITWHLIDLLSPAAGEQIAAIRATHLLHLAWYTEPGLYWTSDENLHWLAASLRLLEAFSQGGGRRLVMAGTCAEYEWEPETHCVEGATPTEPATLYGAAKHALHVTASRYADEKRMSMAWGRVFFAFGPHEHPSRLASSVVRALLSGSEALCSDGEQVRDFLYAPELAEAFVALLCSEVTGPVNMASGEPRPVRDLIFALAEAAGRPELVRLGALPTRPGEPRRLTADVSRLRDEVGWSPSMTLEEAARETSIWWASRT